MVWGLLNLNRKVNRIMVDLAKLQASVDRLVSDVDKVLPLISDPVAAAKLQATADALSAALDTESAKVEAVMPAPAGATGPVA